MSADIEKTEAGLRQPRALLWEPLDGEPHSAYQAFEAYLTLDRPLYAHAAALGRSVSSLQALSARWRWRARREAYKAHLRAVALDSAEAEAAEIAREHARALSLMRQLGTEALERALERGEDLSPRDAAFLVKTAIEGERLIGGQPTARTEIQTDGMSLAALDALHALMSGDADAAREALAIDATPSSADGD